MIANSPRPLTASTAIAIHAVGGLMTAFLAIAGILAIAGFWPAGTASAEDPALRAPVGPIIAPIVERVGDPAPAIAVFGGLADDVLLPAAETQGGVVAAGRARMLLFLLALIVGFAQFAVAARLASGRGYLLGMAVSGLLALLGWLVASPIVVIGYLAAAGCLALSRSSFGFSLPERSPRIGQLVTSRVRPRAS